MATVYNDSKVVGVQVLGGTLPSGGNVASGAADSGNPVKVGGKYNLTLPVLADGQRGDAQVDASGNFRAKLVCAFGASADALGSTVAWATGSSSQALNLPLAVAGYKWNGTAFDRDRKPNGTKRLPSAAASTNADFAKASAGDLHVVNGYNAAATVRYLKFYNKVSAPTVGTDVPVLTLALPSLSAFSFNLNGQYFSTGIAYALTTGAPDADTGALTLADVVGLNITFA